jgi:hypothetical protein
VAALAERFNKRPSEILRLTADEFYLDLCIAFPRHVQRRRDRNGRRAKEKLLGYNPIQKLLAQFRKTA